MGSVGEPHLRWPKSSLPCKFPLRVAQLTLMKGWLCRLRKRGVAPDVKIVETFSCPGQVTPKVVVVHSQRIRQHLGFSGAQDAGGLPGWDFIVELKEIW